MSAHSSGLRLASWPSLGLGALLLAVIAIRLHFVEAETFSYDYRNYLAYLRSIGEIDWQLAAETLQLTFPYMLVSTGVFEIGFVLTAAGLLKVLDPVSAYALMAATSIAVRTLVLRACGMGWGWIVAIQLYAITLFEANALRAGMALTLTLLGMLLVVRRRRAWGLLSLAIAPMLHLQALLLILPWLLFRVVPSALIRHRGGMLLIAAFSLLSCVIALQYAPEIGSIKLEIYAEQISAAVGLTLFSVLAGAWLALLLAELLVDRPRDSQKQGQVREERIAVMTLLISWAVLVFGGALSAVADRVWQFAWVAALPFLSFGRHRLMSSALLALTLGMALVNVLLRYPLSNFFSPFIPYERIVPLWFVP